MLTALTEREIKFVDAYTGVAAGNGARAAEMAGYSSKGAKVQAVRLLRRDNVREAVANRIEQIKALEAEKANSLAKVEQAVSTAEAFVERGKIADAVERREILSVVLRSAAEETVDRIRSVDVLNKMDGVYIQKHEHGGPGGGPINHHVRISVVTPTRAQLPAGA